MFSGIAGVSIFVVVLIVIVIICVSWKKRMLSYDRCDELILYQTLFVQQECNFASDLLNWFVTFFCQSLRLLNKNIFKNKFSKKGQERTCAYYANVLFRLM